MKTDVRTRLKSGDEVLVIAGRDLGKTGTIISIKKNKAFVTGINIVKKHTNHFKPVTLYLGIEV